MPKQIGDLKLFDVDELASILEIQPRTIRQLFRDGKLQGRKLARKWYVSEDSLKSYFSQIESVLEEHQVEE